MDETHPVEDARHETLSISRAKFFFHPFSFVTEKREIESRITLRNLLLNSIVCVKHGKIL